MTQGERCMKHREIIKDYLKTYGVLYLVFTGFACVFMVAGIGVTYGWFETNHRHYAHKEVPALESVEQGSVADAGAVLIRQAIDETDDFFSVKAAYAHASAVCTHSDGVVTNDTGFSRHLTSFRKHENNRHYTVTRHQNLTNSGWVTVGTYRHSETRAFCGCR
jgi:hypothetical protein